MRASVRARGWRTGLLAICVCGLLAAETVPPPNGSMQQSSGYILTVEHKAPSTGLGTAEAAEPELAGQNQPPGGEENLGTPRRAGERPLDPKIQKAIEEARKNADPTIEANLPQRAPSILPRDMNAIDLGCVLRLAGVDNPDILLARQRVARAAALRFLAASVVLPNLNAGMNYDDHNGPVQQSSGNILNVNRQALYTGLGAGAIAAGTVGIPGVQYVVNLSDGLFNWLAMRYNVRARQAENIAVRNQIFLRVATGYMNLVRAESWRSIAIKNQAEAHEIARLTAVEVKRGAGKQADADRAASELARRNNEILDAEQAILVASANLAALLNIPPSVQMHAIDGWVVPTEIVPNTLPLQELIFIATQQRPELAARRNDIREAVMHVRHQIFLPLSPTVMAGYSSGTFGGGSNLVAYPGGFQGFKEPYFGSFAPRQDIDVVMYWTAQNMGIGNLGRFRVARAERRIAELELIRELNRVRDDVAVAHARIHANYAQIDIARRGMEAAYRGFGEDYRLVTTTRNVVLTIELLNNFRLLAAGRMEYLDAVINYDSAQFALYVALGQPPPSNFAHEIPSSDLMPTKPQLTPPLPGCVPPGGGPAACVADKAHP